MKKNKGILAINKSENWTSFDVVNKIKHILKIRQVGHLGTLDPMATGVLLITIGKATKLFDIMQDKIKTYVAEFEFGYSTDTLDKTGKIIDSSQNIPFLSEIQDIIPEFIGQIEQIPPKYSAKNINGERAYDLARKGIDFELKSKTVEIYDIKIISYTDKVLKLEIKCGSGTYIRAIGRDIAKKLNTLATMTSLIRTQVGDISVEKCSKIEDLDEISVDDNIICIKNILNLPKLNLNEELIKKLLNGQTINLDNNDGVYMLNDEFDTIALVKVEKNKAKMSLFMA
ncbi:MAG: tRNA pseudouridine(55) synthase TruB [Clostridia bacterium]|nr:tRNA pseudouridine(55) synthase TruB [Clostridia bacterium]